MLHINHENETPMRSNYYQNDMNSPNPEEPDNTQDITKWTPHIFETNPNMNHIYQKTTNKLSPPKKNLDNHFFLESPKNKNLQPPDLQIDFLIDNDAESKLLPHLLGMKSNSYIHIFHFQVFPENLPLHKAEVKQNMEKYKLFYPNSNNGTKKLIQKPFRQMFHIIDIKHNIVGIPFISNTSQVFTSY